MIAVSVLVVCLNEAAHVGPALDSLLAQDYAGPLEIVVVDGASTDGTQDIVRGYAKRHDAVRLVIEPARGVAAGRNAGVAAAIHPMVAFIDGDCTAPPDWLSTLVRGYERWKARDASIVAVGGRNVAPDQASDFVRAVSVALDSFPGSFNAVQGRQSCEECLAPTLPTLNVLYEKQAILDANGFDQSLGSEAEDADLNHRIGRLGGRLGYVPQSWVVHWMRATPRQWFRNMVRYGRGRARLLKRHPDMRSAIYALPPLFLFGMALVLMAPVSAVFALPLLYFPAILAYSARLARRKGVAGLTLHVALVFVVQHFGYALGEVSGLLNPRVA